MAARSASGSVRARSAGSAPGGKRGHGHVDLVMALPLVDAAGALLARRVGVVGEHHASGEVAQQPEVVLAQRGATRGHGTGHPGQEEGDDVGVPLAHDDLAVLDDVVLGPVEPVQGAALGVDRTVLGVLVLGPTGVDAAAAVTGSVRAGCVHPGRWACPRVEDGEDHAGPEGVLRTAPSVDEAEARVGEHLVDTLRCLASASQSSGAHPRRNWRTDVAVVAARAQVVAGRPGVGGRQEPLVVEVDRLGHGLVQRGPPLALGGGRGVLGDGDAAAFGQAPDGLDEVDVLDLAHEGDGVARLLAPEAVEHAHLGVDAERGRLLLVERAQPHPAGALLLERGVFADERHDVGGGPHTDDVLIRDGHAPDGTARSCQSAPGRVRPAQLPGPGPPSDGEPGACGMSGGRPSRWPTACRRIPRRPGAVAVRFLAVVFLVAEAFLAGRDRFAAVRGASSPSCAPPLSCGPSFSCARWSPCEPWWPCALVVVAPPSPCAPSPCAPWSCAPWSCAPWSCAPWSCAPDEPSWPQGAFRWQRSTPAGTTAGLRRRRCPLPGLQHPLGGRQPGDGHPERRAAHVVAPGVGEHGDRLGVSAVLPAHADLERRPGRPAPGRPPCGTSSPTPSASTVSKGLCLRRPFSR